jgi:hypothetical protein
LKPDFPFCPRIRLRLTRLQILQLFTHKLLPFAFSIQPLERPGWHGAILRRSGARVKQKAKG